MLKKSPDWQKKNFCRMTYINIPYLHHFAGNSSKLPVELMKNFYIPNSFICHSWKSWVKLRESSGDSKSCTNDVFFLTFDQLREGKYNYFSKLYCRKTNWTESAKKCLVLLKVIRGCWWRKFNQEYWMDKQEGLKEGEKNSEAPEE